MSNTAGTEKSPHVDHLHHPVSKVIDDLPGIVRRPRVLVAGPIGTITVILRINQSIDCRESSASIGKQFRKVSAIVSCQFELRWKLPNIGEYLAP